MNNIKKITKPIEVIKQARIAAQLTQEDLAKAANVTRLNVVNLELGKNVGFHIVVKIMAALNLNLTGKNKATPIARERKRVRNLKVNALNYPQLRLVLWDHKDKTINEDQAFYAYEKNFKFLDIERMDDGERVFFNKLVNKFGQGVLNV